MVQLSRDKDGIAHIVGMSGGKDSSCLSIALKEVEGFRPYNYVYTPTGAELPEMDAHIGRMERLLGQSIIRVTNGTLDGLIELTGVIPNARMRHCTRILKLKPFAKLVEANAPVVVYVGLRDDEDEREGARAGGDSMAIGTAAITRYPFQEWGWGLEKIISYLAERNVIIPERTDCAECFYQRLGEWYNLWLYHRDRYLKAEAKELKYGHTFRSPSRDTWPAGLKELREKFEAGIIPERSLRMMEKRQGMCRVCSM